MLARNFSGAFWRKAVSRKGRWTSIRALSKPIHCQYMKILHLVNHRTETQYDLPFCHFHLVHQRRVVEAQSGFEALSPDQEPSVEIHGDVLSVNLWSHCNGGTLVINVFGYVSQKSCKLGVSAGEEGRIIFRRFYFRWSVEHLDCARQSRPNAQVELTARRQT
jgi:hypothetical protein